MGMETGLWGLEFGLGYPDLLGPLLDRDDPWEIHVAQFQPHGLKLHGERLVEQFSNRRVTDIQIPIQSTSDRIMKMMNRKNHSQIISPMLRAVRQQNPRVVLRTDVIVGWPTETKAERVHSLEYAAEHYDEVAVYAIELNPDLPAWKYQEDAFSPEELDEILVTSREFLSARGVSAHSGQQDDASMAEAEAARITLRESRTQLGMPQVPSKAVSNGAKVQPAPGITVGG
jgi:tRNA A37 methylthiotransferase MiaB